MIIWHMLSKDADRCWAGLALLARKFRSVELRASLPTSHARRGTAFDYNIPAKRADERSRVEKAEAAYAAASSPMANAAGKARAVEKAAEREEGSILHLRTALPMQVIRLSAPGMRAYSLGRWRGRASAPRR